jgi:hypothetical protein
MKKLLMVLLSASLLSAFLLTGCNTDSEENTATDTASATETYTEPTSLTLKEGDTWAIDKLKFNYMPEGWEAFYDQETHTRAQVNNETLSVTVDFEGVNYAADNKPLESTADSAMAALKMNYMVTTSSEVDVEAPKTVTVGETGAEGIWYDFIVHFYRYEYDEEGEAVKGEDGKDKRELVGNLKSIAVYFYAGDAAYSIIFQCQEGNFDEFYPEFEKFFNNISIE